MKALAAIAVGAAVALSGCGTATPEEQISQQVAKGAKAVGEQDAKALCEIMNPRARQWAIDYMSRVNPQSCEEAAAEGMKTLSPENRARISKTRAVKIVITGNSAEVWISPRVVNGIPQPVPFSRGLSGWKAG